MKILSIFIWFMYSLSVVSQAYDSSRVYEIWDNQPAPNRGQDHSWSQARGYPSDPDWESHSYPLGNGYMGANVFGRTDVERIQITEKTLANEGLYGIGGLTSFGEIYLEFDHYHSLNYKRALNLNDAILYIAYEHEGVRYTREYLANYPDNVIAIRLTADQKNKISFTLRAVIPYLRSDSEINTKFGITKAENDLITFSGNIKHFSVNYEGQVKVINEGGKLFADNDNGSEIRVEKANSVVLLIAAGTNYKLSEKVFLEETENLKLDRNVFPHKEVSARIKQAAAKGYDGLKASHLEDYQQIFSRVTLNISPSVPQIPTKTLVENYKQDPSNTYLEELMFHFGRYLLIASSRKGTLPCGLQGIWSQYHVTPFTGGYWHNINVQMNYWGAFNTNMAETFTPYAEYFNAFLPNASKGATEYIKKNNPDQLGQGENSNGWAVGTGTTAYHTVPPGGHSGPGTTGFTSKLFWERYAFTMDTTFLREIAYPVLLGTSTFLSKTLKPDEDGVLLVNPSASPEQIHNGHHYMTKGATFDQGFVREAHHDLINAAQILGTHDEQVAIAKFQIDKLDPIIIGESGQIKEFREESTYGEIGDPRHRHISHLCPIYPGTLINSSHPQWIKAVSTVLDLRGNKTTGWAMAHRMNVRARTKEAEKAHEVYSKFLRERTLPNLWTVHPPFQIDGNLGTMAGVAEMLIQSHEGFIELLPALPKAWARGSFDGLVARGNFEVSLNWDKGKIRAAKITSKSGGTCRIKHTNIAGAKLTDANGRAVSTVTKNKNMIEFDTNKMEEYFITL